MDGGQVGKTSCQKKSLSPDIANVVVFQALFQLVNETDVFGVPLAFVNVLAKILKRAEIVKLGLQ